jgi:hypothetical protein
MNSAVVLSSDELASSDGTRITVKSINLMKLITSILITSLYNVKFVQ